MADWAAHQLLHTYDLSLTGIPRLDVWVTAGLSPHVVHHLLPFQRSPYTNVASQAAVRAAVERRGLAWPAARPLLTQGVRAFLRDYVLAAPCLTPRQALEEGWFTRAHVAAGQAVGCQNVPLYPNCIVEHLSLRAVRSTIGHVFSGCIGFGTI